MMEIKKYLFDFDGTLVDSMDVYANAVYKFLDINKVEYSKDIIKILTPLGITGLAKYLIEQLKIDCTFNDVKEFMEENMYKAYFCSVQAKSNVVSTLRALKESGADLNVLTASPHLTVDPCLKRLGIYDLFTNVWSCEDFKTTKSNPQIYELAAQKLNANVQDVLFLDDNYNADMTAKQAGMKVCGVYDKYSEEYANEMKEICDYYIYDFKELLEL